MKKKLILYSLTALILSSLILAVDIKVFSSLQVEKINTFSVIVLVILNFGLNLLQNFYITYQEIQIRELIINKAFNSAFSKEFVTKDYLHMVLSESVQYAKVIKNIIELCIGLFLIAALLIYLILTNDVINKFKFYILLIIIFGILVFSFPKYNPLIIASVLRYRLAKRLNNFIINAYNLMMDFRYLNMNYSFKENSKSIFKKNSIIYGLQTVISNIPAKSTELFIFIMLFYAATKNSNDARPDLAVSLITSYGYITLRLRTLIVQSLNIFIRVANKKHSITAFDKYINKKNVLKISKDYLNEKLFVNNNKIINLYGDSGTGKSTYLFHLFNKTFKKRNVSLTLQSPSLDYDNFKANFSEFNKNEQKILMLFDKFGLSKRFRRRVPEKVKYLSGGEIKRIAIIRQLILQSKINLIDEPFSEIDLKNQKILREILNEMASKSIVIITGHKKLIGALNIKITNE